MFKIGIRNNVILGIKSELKKISAEIETEEAIKNDIDYHKPKIEVCLKLFLVTFFNFLSSVVQKPTPMKSRSSMKIAKNLSKKLSVNLSIFCHDS